jgi:hypothetical protein
MNSNLSGLSLIVVKEIVFFSGERFSCLTWQVFLSFLGLGLNIIGLFSSVQGSSLRDYWNICFAQIAGYG